jgi:hypothetical protein
VNTNTTTAAKVIASGQRTLKVMHADMHGQRYPILGTVCEYAGMAYLLVDACTMGEWSLTLGGLHTPIEYI